MFCNILAVCFLILYVSLGRVLWLPFGKVTLAVMEASLHISHLKVLPTCQLLLGELNFR